MAVIGRLPPLHYELIRLSKPEPVGKYRRDQKDSNKDNCLGAYVLNKTRVSDPKPFNHAAPRERAPAVC